jgi:ribosomal subunit interface protein
MKTPLQITFHGMTASQAVEARTREKAAMLERFCPEIMACRVTVDLLQKHRQQGRPFGVRIDVTIPGRELAVDRVEHEDVHVALRDAFDAMRRQLEDAVRRVRGDVKQHAGELHGEVARLSDDFGFIRTADGDEYYFHRDNVHGVDFDRLAVGNAVRFLGDGRSSQGPQAKRVTLHTR